LLALLGNLAPSVRAAAAAAIAGGLVEHRAAAAVTIQRLKDIYAAALPPPTEQVAEAQNP
jgi:hypothetical protein